MRTTIRLRDDPLQRAKKKAAEEGRTLTSLVEEGLMLVLTETKETNSRRISLPVSKTSGGVLSVGTELDRNEYEKCKGSSTKLHKIIRKLSPDYNKLAQFTQAITSADPDAPPLVTWDHGVLMKSWGVISNYLHWAGEPAETVESDTWFNTGVQAVEDACYDTEQHGGECACRHVNHFHLSRSLAESRDTER